MRRVQCHCVAYCRTTIHGQWPHERLAFAATRGVHACLDRASKILPKSALCNQHRFWPLEAKDAGLFARCGGRNNNIRAHKDRFLALGVAGLHVNSSALQEHAHGSVKAAAAISSLCEDDVLSIHLSVCIRVQPTQKGYQATAISTNPTPTPAMQSSHDNSVP